MMTISKPVFDRIGLGLWVALFLVILVMAMWAPEVRSVVPTYRDGSEAFLAGQPLYNIDAAAGYLYAPAFAAFFIPFFKLGPHFGDLLWRVLSFAVLTFAAVRQVRKISGPEQSWLLSYGLFLALPMALGAIRNGQATILLAGACWLLTLSALEGRRVETFLWASLALIAKPLAIVMVLLVGALRLRLIPVLILALLFVLALPYAVAPFDYVNGQYHDFAETLTTLAVDRKGTFLPTDFTAIFAAFGAALPLSVIPIVRVVAALLTLAAVIWFDKNLEPRMGGLAVFLAAAFYMCVFNPRVEPNTYAMIAVPAGLAIGLLWREERGGALGAALATVLFLAGLTGVEVHVHNFLHPWFRPIIVTVIALSLMWWFRGRAREKDAGAGAAAR